MLLYFCSYFKFLKIKCSFAVKRLPFTIYVQKNMFCQCGTQAPVWINGTHPDVTEGIVQRTSCANYGSDRPLYGPCCDIEIDIEIKNCGSFYVYHLSPTDSCPISYCGGVFTCLKLWPVTLTFNPWTLSHFFRQVCLVCLLLYLDIFLSCFVIIVCYLMCCWFFVFVCLEGRSAVWV